MKANSQQQRVIDELDSNILLLASAGTGKTNTLALRVARIIEMNKAKPSEILCMTFTNKACREMKERIMNRVGVDARAVEIHTFHSFCYTILQEEAKRDEGLYTDITIFDEEDCRELLAPFKPEGVREIDFQTIIGIIKEERAVYNFYSNDRRIDYLKTVEIILAENDKARQLCNAFGYKSIAHMQENISTFKQRVVDVVEGYQHALAVGHGVDFTDLIIGVYELFREDSIRERWRSRFRYIAVDEMQDTSTLEYAVMKQMWPGNIVLLCGDFFQTIYEWRGSNPLVLLELFRNEFQPQVIVFYENYRSNQLLFEAAFNALKGMFPHMIDDFYEETPYAVTQEEGQRIQVHEVLTEFDESRRVYDAISKVPEEERDSIGILVRGNHKAQYLSRMFELFNKNLLPENRLNFMIIDDFKFFRRQEIKDVLAFFKLVANPHDTVSAKRIIKRFVEGIGEARMAAIESDDCRKVGLKLTDFLDMGIFQDETYARLLKGLENNEVIVYDVESTGTDTTTDQIIQIAAIRIDKDGKPLEVFERFIRPTKSVGQSASVHGFTDEKLAEIGRPAAEVLQEFKEFSRGAVIVGHNVNYDVSIFTSELHRHNLGKPEFEAVFDTLDIFRRFYPNLSNHKLGFLSEQFPINHTPTHNAMDDIIATGMLLLYAVQENILPTQDKRRAYISSFKSYFADIATKMSTLRRKAKQDKPTAVLAYIMNDLGVSAYYASHNEAHRVKHIRDLYRIFEQLEKELVEYTTVDRIKVILQLAALTAGEPANQFVRGTQIPIITVHQAKGSEFDYVFLVGLNDGVFPSYMSVREGKLDEEKRLFYVALTRARKALTITYACQSGKKELRPSPFLQFIPLEYQEFHKY